MSVLQPNSSKHAAADGASPAPESTSSTGTRPGLSSIRRDGVGLTPRRLAGVLGIMVLGTAVVLGSLIIMNQFVDGPEEGDVDNTVSFSVPPQEPERPPQPEEPQRREPRRTERPALAPPPNLGSNLSGIAVALPEFQATGVGNVSESLLGELDDVALTENEVDNKPVVQNNPLEYPERARQRDINEGRVVVSALIGRDGAVKQLQVLEASHPVFAEAVRQAVPNWTFRPATYRGQPVETWVRIPIPFSTS